MKLRRYKSIFEDHYDLEKKYKLFNKVYFNNILPFVKLTFVSSLPKNHAGEAHGHSEIKINKTYFSDYTERQKDSLLIHEMVHIYISFIGKSNEKNKYGQGLNLHKGEFIRKAKEIEHKNPDLTILGTTMTKTTSDYSGQEQKSLFILISYPPHKFKSKRILNAGGALLLDKIPNNEKLLEFAKKIWSDSIIELYEIKLNTILGSYENYYPQTQRKQITTYISDVKDLLNAMRKNKEYVKYLATYSSKRIKSSDNNETWNIIKYPF